MTTESAQHRLLVRWMLISVAAAIATIALKSIAAWLTGSVGFLSDAMESVVNLVAALVGLIAVRTASKPPDDVHHFGHGNAEYLSAAVEGTMIFVAAVAIVVTSVQRLFHPVEVEQLGIGLGLSMLAAVINLVVGQLLIRVGREHRSMTLQADGKHLMTDVWTTAGVLVAISLVPILHWKALDPIIGLLVGLNIIRVGYQLLRRSVIGLLDAALPAAEALKVTEVIDRYRRERSVDFQALRTQESGRQRFVYVDVVIPGSLTLNEAHQIAEDFTADLAAVLPGVVTFTHLEPAPEGLGGVDSEGKPSLNSAPR